MVAVRERIGPKPSRRKERFGEHLRLSRFEPSVETDPADRFAVPRGVDTLTPMPVPNTAREPRRRSKQPTRPSNSGSARQTLSAVLQVATNRVVAALTRIAFADIGDVFDEHGAVIPFADLPPGIRSAIAVYRVRHHRNGTCTVRVSLRPKVPALAALDRHFGAFSRGTENGPSEVFRVAHRPAAPRSTRPEKVLGG